MQHKKLQLDKYKYGESLVIHTSVYTKALYEL